MKKKFDPQCITFSQMNIIFNMRIFWLRLTIWTRIYIISRYLGVGTAEESFERLYIENSDFGDVMRIPFNRSKSDQYSQLLNQFSIGLRDLITARIQGDSNVLRQSIDRLLFNTTQHASFLASINPYLNEEEWRNLLVSYLQDTMEEANLFASKDYRMDIEYFDRLMSLSNTMGDTFAQTLYDYITSGDQIVSSTPPQGAQECLTMKQVNQIYSIRMFWFDLINWTRALMLSIFQDVGNENEVYERLQKVVSDQIENLTQLFGASEALNQLSLELNAYIDLIDALITAQKAGNADETGSITRQLYQNADSIAASFAAINPEWDQNQWRTRLYSLVRSTLEESTMFLTEDYARNMDIFSTLMNLAESASDDYAQGLLNQILKI